MTDLIVRTRFGIWSGGRKLGVVEADDAREAVQRFVMDMHGASRDELTPLVPDGSAVSWRGAGFRAAPNTGSDGPNETKEPVPGKA